MKRVVAQHGNDPGVRTTNEPIRWYEIRDPTAGLQIIAREHAPPDGKGALGRQHRRRSPTRTSACSITARDRRLPEIMFTGRVRTDTINDAGRARATKAPACVAGRTRWAITTESLPTRESLRLLRPSEGRPAGSDVEPAHLNFTMPCCTTAPFRPPRPRRRGVDPSNEQQHHLDAVGRRRTIRLSRDSAARMARYAVTVNRSAHDLRE